MVPSNFSPPSRLSVQIFGLKYTLGPKNTLCLYLGCASSVAPPYTTFPWLNVDQSFPCHTSCMTDILLKMISDPNYAGLWQNTRKDSWVNTYSRLQGIDKSTSRPKNLPRWSQIKSISRVIKKNNKMF